MAVAEIAAGLEFPEGPISFSDGSLLVVEVAAGALTRIDRQGTSTRIAMLGGGPNGAAMGPNRRCYICNNGGMVFKRSEGRLFGGLFLPEPGSIQVVDLATGRFETMYGECDGKPLSAPNDLVFDAHGGFWFTDHGKVFRDTVERGALYYAKADGSGIVRAFAPLDGPNGIGLSPDGKRLYVAETVPGRVWAFDIGAPGEIRKSERAQLARRAFLLAGLPGYQLLDSLAVDVEGWICVATLVNGGITAISPDGLEVEHIPLPDPITTNLCFGGKGLQTAYVTLGSSGRIVALDWPRSGLRLHHQE